MSDIPRFDCLKKDGMIEWVRGEYVLQSDYAKLQAENERLRKLVEWQPIETAPLDDKTEVLVVDCGDIYVGIFDKKGFCSDFYNAGLSPTHWMPLPDAPKEGRDVK